jgi:glucose-1-phosphate thymidylyltransferase
MKGVIFAGGLGTRISDLIGPSNKHLIPIGRETVINISIRYLIESGVDELLIITNKGWEDIFSSVFKKDKNIDPSSIQITYSKDPALQLADVLFEAVDFVEGEDFLLFLGDNIFLDSPVKFVKNLVKMEGTNIIILARAKDPSLFGVPIFKENIIREIIEKPGQFTWRSSNLVVTGLARYTAEVFDFIKLLFESSVQKRDLTALHNLLIRTNKLKYIIYEGNWYDIGTVDNYTESLRTINKSRILQVPDLSEIKEILQDIEASNKLIELYKELFYGQYK